MRPLPLSRYYSGRRVWGVYRLLAPSLTLPAEYEEYRKSRPYPVTARADKKLTVADVARAMRSFYEGTKYDGTAGLAAGPWGNPDHVSTGSKSGAVKGNWERTIGLWRTSDSYIVQSRSWLTDGKGGVLWCASSQSTASSAMPHSALPPRNRCPQTFSRRWGAHAAPYTVYVPFATGMRTLPSMTLGHPAKLDKTTLFWAVRYLANLAKLKHDRMYVELQSVQARLYNASLLVVSAADHSDGTADTLSKLYEANARNVLRSLWELTDELMFKYADGYINGVSPSRGNDELRVSPDYYPDWWLAKVGYTDGPPPVPKAGAHATSKQV